MDLKNIYSSSQQQKLSGRYITNNDIEPLLSSISNKQEFRRIGFSVNKLPIYSYQIGTGKIKILLWSQMHGNESTTTKALMDFLNFLNSKSDLSNEFLKEFTFYCIPILNPDGAALYSRENANKIDLNRDFLNLSQPESNYLVTIFNDFNPNYCYNMHDQRTIFGVSDTQKPTTIAFLAPSFNESRSFNNCRLKAANVIVEMNKTLQQYIPGQVALFDDGFNINCAGDYFQSRGVPTILFEAGHFYEDYSRDETRKYIFIAIISGLKFLINKSENNFENIEYLKMSHNIPIFYDYIYKNVKVIDYNLEKTITFAIQYKEQLINSKIEFVGIIVKVDGLDNFKAHKEFDANGMLFKNNLSNCPKVNDLANFKLDNNVIVNGKFINKL